MTVLLALAAWPSVSLADGPMAKAPCMIENVGQYDTEVRFGVLGGGSARWLVADGLWLAIEDDEHQGQAIKLRFDGANDDVDIQPTDQLPTRISYFRGDAPDQWHTNIPAWRGVRYVDLYPGIDLLVTGDEHGWHWVLEPNPRLAGTDRSEAIAQVRLCADGGELLTTKNGLVVKTELGAMAIPALSTSNQACEAILSDLDNPTQLVYATYLGGMGEEAAEDIAVDDAGCVHVVGWTTSTTFPTEAGSYDTSLGGDKDAIVCKLTADGSGLEYATFLGGSGEDRGHSICLDAAGNAYLAGMTASEDMPTTEDVIGQTDKPGVDAFCAKLGPSGTSLEFCTYFGAGGEDHALGIAVDASGAAYLTGHTTSEADPETPEGFPIIPGSWMQDKPGIMDNENVFVCKLSPQAVTMTYSLVMGTPGLEQGTEIEVDATGRATVLGWTNHLSFTTTPGDFGNTYGGSLYDVFCMQFSDDGHDLNYSRLIGGSGWDEPGDLILDTAGNAIIGGWTGSHDFPLTAGAHQTEWLTEQVGEDTIQDNKAGFVAKLNATGDSLAFSTFVGGMGVDQVHGVALDGGGNLYLSGDTTSADLPTTSDALDTTYNGAQSWGGDTFLCAMDPTGSTLTYGTYFGGSDADARAILAMSPSGQVYMAGRTLSDDLPEAMGTYSGSGGDIFCAQFDLGAEPMGWRLALPLLLAQ